MEEFKTYTLEELSLNKGTYGIAASAVPYDDSKLTYLRITDINDDGTLNTQSLMSVDEPNASDYLSGQQTGEKPGPICQVRIEHLWEVKSRDQTFL